MTIPWRWWSSCGVQADADASVISLAGSLQTTPGALVRNERLNHVLHERVVVLTITTDHVPRCDEENRLEIKPLPNGFFRVIAHF